MRDRWGRSAGRAGGEIESLVRQSDPGHTATSHRIAMQSCGITRLLSFSVNDFRSLAVTSLDSVIAIDRL